MELSGLFLFALLTSPGEEVIAYFCPAFFSLERIA